MKLHIFMKILCLKTIHFYSGNKKDYLVEVFETFFYFYFFKATF